MLDRAVPFRDVPFNCSNICRARLAVAILAAPSAQLGLRFPTIWGDRKSFPLVTVSALPLGDLGMEDIYKKPSDISTVFRDLNGKFSDNLNSSIRFSAETLCSVELKARALDAVGRILSQTNTITPAQREILPIFNELFADVISSLYLAACALDKPAQIVLRRVLELGVAIVYLWDLPHKFYGWKQHDHDLNFSEMVDHVNAPQYVTFVKSANSSFNGSTIIEVSEAKRIYGSLSDTVHGKISTFESVLPDRFKFTKEDWQTHLSLVDTVENLLLKLFQNRFHDVNSSIHKQFPQIART